MALHEMLHVKRFFSNPPSLITRCLGPVSTQPCSRAYPRCVGELSLSVFSLAPWIPAPILPPNEVATKGVSSGTREKAAAAGGPRSEAKASDARNRRRELPGVEGRLSTDWPLVAGCNV